LSDPGGWRRETAQRLLVERGARLRSAESPSLSAEGRALVAKLATLAGTAKDWRVRLRALWTLDGLDAIAASSVLRALEDASSEVRASAVRLAERWLPESPGPVHAAVLKRVDDPDLNVRRQLAASVGAMRVEDRVKVVAPLLQHHGSDPITLDAAISSVQGSEPDLLEVLLEANEQTAQIEAAITMLSATVMKSGDNASIQRVLGWVARGSRVEWQQSALLRGAEVVLLGATMPATPAQRVVTPLPNAPCLTCPGGRAGPGGAYAYSTPEDFVRAGLRTEGRGGRPALRLGAEPLALSNLAAEDGALSARAASVLGRLTWPGKIGAEEAAPLSPTEQRRFEVGRELYRNVCQACHQPDGRGLEKVAPSLIGSPLALAPADIPARILLNGKEGPIGLMPPIGSTISDEEIASVLTYVRREWGQTGGAVDPATVTAVRTASATRTRPWTNDELLALTKREAK
jgi:mono/diheme cytochrome c family protein